MDDRSDPSTPPPLRPTEGRLEGGQDLDGLETAALVDRFARQDEAAAAAVTAAGPALARAVDVVAERLAGGGRLVYVGAGTSGRLGVLDAVECGPTFDVGPERVIALLAGGPSALTQSIEGAEDDERGAHAELDALGLCDRDVVVAIAASGRTPYCLGALAFARERAAFRIALTCVPESPLAAAADLAIEPIVGPEVLSGSTRLKAGTATKLVLNTLSTSVMVKLGRTFGDLMVDLRATNEKLRARALRILRQCVELEREDAADLLSRCDGEVKTAIAAGRLALSPAEARARLASVDGHLRRLLEAQP